MSNSHFALYLGGKMLKENGYKIKGNFSYIKGEITVYISVKNEDTWCLFIKNDKTVGNTYNLEDLENMIKTLDRESSIDDLLS